MRGGVNWILLGIAAYPCPAFAYRPFDGTDAAVVAPGELEVEIAACRSST